MNEPMPEPKKTIEKIGIAIFDRKRLLIARKINTTLFLLPGGRRENGEDDISALKREIQEELACDLDPATVEWIGEFSDAAANEPQTTVVVRLYRGAIRGVPVPSSEIEELRWFGRDDDGTILAPSIQRKILPHLIEHGYM